MNVVTRLLPWFFCVLLSATALAQPYGLASRLPNSTLQMPQAPATYGYTLTNGYSGFISPICAATPPGESNRLFVVERAGRIVAITNLSLTTGGRVTFLDISARVTTPVEEGMLGLAFHPGYATNGYFFVTYSYTNIASPNSGIYNRLSRFQVSANTNVADPSSELVLISQLDEAGNHNGGDIHFGPDGYLYVTLGDEGQQSDFYLNSQRIDKDFFSGILRLDVDKRATNLAPNPHASLLGQTNYYVPADNPFVGVTQFNGTNLTPASVRTEFWAVGLRNPWRISFDSLTGTLYCGDVGGSAREEINVIVKGGNYGWVWREGTLAGPDGSRQGPIGFTFVPPIFEYDHGFATNQGNSVTGGRVYRGSRISQLYGKYVFCDYVSGNIWALTPDGTNTVPSVERLFGTANIVSFAADSRNGDLLLVNLAAGALQRLVYNTNITSGTALPATLADTGAYANITNLTPSTGVVPFDINVPFWSDNAQKTRWFSVPGATQTITFNRDGNWLFPTGAVWIKHFDLELTNGSPASLTRLETRLLVKNAAGLYGVTYRWGGSTSNATLLPEEGMDEPFVLNDGGILRTQVWHYPSRSQCLDCHTSAGGYTLGFNTAQMNRDFAYTDATDNQLRALDHAGYFTPPVTNRHTLRALAHATNAAFSLEYRVRSYLAANCRQCHQPGGTARGSWDARIENPLSLAAIVNGALQNDLGDAANRVIVPNDVAHSILLARVSQNGPLHMPPLASNLIDTNAVNLVSAWISSLANYQTYAQWQLANFGSTTAPLTGPLEDFDGDGLVNYAEYLLGTNPNSPTESWSINLSLNGNNAQMDFPQIANRGFEIQYTTNLLSPVWQPLDVPENRPVFSSTNFQATVPDLLTNVPKFYRLRIFEP